MSEKEKPDMLGPVVRKLGQLGPKSLGIMFDLLEKLTGRKMYFWWRTLKKFLRQEDPWATQFFEITTTKYTSSEWIDCFEKHDYIILHGRAKEVLRLAEFLTSDSITYKLALIMGDEFEEHERNNNNIRAKAASKGWIAPPIDVAPLLPMIFSNRDLKRMGLKTLVVMHDPITTSDDNLYLLAADGNGNKQNLSVFRGEPHMRWVSHTFGFLFLVPDEPKQ